MVSHRQEANHARHIYDFFFSFFFSSCHRFMEQTSRVPSVPAWKSNKFPGLCFLPPSWCQSLHQQLLCCPGQWLWIIPKIHCYRQFRVSFVIICGSKLIGLAVEPWDSNNCFCFIIVVVVVNSCLLDSKRVPGVSQFISRTNDTLRFSLRAFQFVAEPEIKVSV